MLEFFLFVVFFFLAHLALPKWAYIIMIHEMDPNMGSWFKLCGICVICVHSSLARVLITRTSYFADISHNTPRLMHLKYLVDIMCTFPLAAILLKILKWLSCLYR